MLLCPYCHTVVSEDSRFCPECGRPLAVGGPVVGGAVKGKSKKNLAGIIIACAIAIILTIVLVSVKPWVPTYTLSVGVNPPQAGFVSSSGGEYKSGVQVTVTAYPASGYTFDYWSGSASDTVSTITITMDSDASLTAHFKTIPTVPVVLFSDDFSQAGVWGTGSDESGSVFYSNGWLHLINYSSATLATTTYAHQYLSDFILEVETMLVGGTENNWHQVACRYQDKDNYYMVGISADGYYDITKLVNGSRVELVWPSYSSYINQGVEAVNLIHIECIGTDLSLSVNGHLLTTVTDATISSGDIGLGASSSGGSFTEIAFDNIVVSKP